MQMSWQWRYFSPIDAFHMFLMILLKATKVDGHVCGKYPEIINTKGVEVLKRALILLQVHFFLTQFM